MEGVRRWSEIIDCPDDAGTEKVMPNAVDHDACRVDYPAGSATRRVAASAAREPMG